MWGVGVERPSHPQLWLDKGHSCPVCHLLGELELWEGAGAGALATARE